MQNRSSQLVPTLTPTSVTVPMALQRHPAVGRNRIYEAIANGALNGIKVGRRLAIPVEDLDLWVADGCPTLAEGGR